MLKENLKNYADKAEEVFEEHYWTIIGGACLLFMGYMTIDNKIRNDKLAKDIMQEVKTQTLIQAVKD